MYVKVYVCECNNVYGGILAVWITRVWRSDRATWAPSRAVRKPVKGNVWPSTATDDRHWRAPPEHFSERHPCYNVYVRVCADCGHFGSSKAAPKSQLEWRHLWSSGRACRIGPAPVTSRALWSLRGVRGGSPFQLFAGTLQEPRLAPRPLYMYGARLSESVGPRRSCFCRSITQAPRRKPPGRGGDGPEGEGERGNYGPLV